MSFVVEATVNKSQTDFNFRMFKRGEIMRETISQKYKKRYDKVTVALHFDLCRKYDFKSANMWCRHVPERIIESKDY